MSLFAAYLKELGTKEIFEAKHGFATFYPFNDGLYIEDIYVEPKYRSQGYASTIAIHIEGLAKQRGFKKIYGSVRPSAKTSTDALKVLLAYGFKLDSAASDAILFVKELSWAE